MNDIIEGLQIFLRNGASNNSTFACHDVFGGPHLGLAIPKKDLDRLEALGWFKSEEYDCWCIFV